jgi:hypothetical protein
MKKYTLTATRISGEVVPIAEVSLLPGTDPLFLEMLFARIYKPPKGAYKLGISENNVTPTKA